MHFGRRLQLLHFKTEFSDSGGRSSKGHLDMWVGRQTAKLLCVYLRLGVLISEQLGRDDEIHTGKIRA